MDIAQKAKEGLETRVKAIEELIESKGIGAKQLEKAKKTQKYLNLTIVAGAAAAILGAIAWATLGSDDEE